MLRPTGRWFAILAVAFGVVGASARAQFAYPWGYGGFGWGGWGGAGSTVQGSIAYGMGHFAANLGTYKERRAQANAINAQSAMEFNNYLSAINRRNAANEMLRRNRRLQRVNESRAATFARLRDNPDSFDIQSGSALNVVLDELTNPGVLPRVVPKATQSIDSQLVRNIVFQYAPKMIAISLEDLSARGMPDALATNPAFGANRDAIKALITKAEQEADSENRVSVETLRSFRTAIKAMQDKVAATFPRGTRDRSQSDNFLKALYGLSRMLEDPAVDQFLAGLNRYPTTTVGHLITFMSSFNLRFGPAATPAQRAAYDQLHPILVALRDASDARGPNPAAAEVALPDPKKVTDFFSGMEYDDFEPQKSPSAVPGSPQPE